MNHNPDPMLYPDSVWARAMPRPVIWRLRLALFPPRCITCGIRADRARPKRGGCHTCHYVNRRED